MLSTIKVQDNRKRVSTQIKNIPTFIVAPHSDSNESVRVPRKNKAWNDVQFKKQGKKTPEHHGAQSYGLLCVKEGMPERNYMCHSSEECFGKRSDQK